MKKFLLAGVTAWAALSGICALAAATPETNQPASQLTIPYVPTRHDVVRDMLWLAEVGKDDVVYDLGSGDGRIVIAAVRDFGARKAVGIDIDAQRIRESVENAKRAGVTNRVEFIQGDLFTNDFSQATAVTLFLGGGPNIELRRKLMRTLKPGTRIVSHMYGMGEWAPERQLRVKTFHLGMYGYAANRYASNPNVPDFSEPVNRSLGSFRIPARPKRACQISSTVKASSADSVANLPLYLVWLPG